MDLKSSSPLKLSLIPEVMNSDTSVFYAEYFENLERAPEADRKYLISLVIPLLHLYSPANDVDDIVQFYFYNKQITESYLLIIRNSSTHQIEAVQPWIVTSEYFLPRLYTKENQFLLFSCYTIVNTEAREKGILGIVMKLYAYLLHFKYPGRNRLLLDAVISPIIFHLVSKLSPIYPSHYKEVPVLARDLMLRWINKFEYQSVSEDDPLVVKELMLKGFDVEYWVRKYKNASVEMKYFIDRAGRAPGLALVCFQCSSVLQGNTLGLMQGEFFVSYELPVLTKVYRFGAPRI